MFITVFTRARNLSLSNVRLPSYFLEMHINIILLSTPRSFKWSLSFRLPHQNRKCTRPLPRMCYISFQGIPGHRKCQTAIYWHPYLLSDTLKFSNSERREMRNSHSANDKEANLVGYYTLSTGAQVPTLCRSVLSSRSVPTTSKITFFSYKSQPSNTSEEFSPSSLNRHGRKWLQPYCSIRLCRHLSRETEVEQEKSRWM
jgi:hypothetical protein